MKMDVEVVRATPEQETVLANLLELYAHDFSEFMETEIGADGRYGYPQLSLYWAEPERHPFLIKVEGKLAGFVLVQQGSQITGDEGVWDVAEFFILRGYRRHKIGINAGRQVWEMFRGRWEVRVMLTNRAAKEFWQYAIGEFTGTAIQPTLAEINGKRWHVFSFQS
ncbi:MAG TPA: GNAT family N-acetyltransferase [Pyrinomonadaceae bacterium]|jgi:predicted acetyltransferase